MHCFGLFFKRTVLVIALWILSFGSIANRAEADADIDFSSPAAILPSIANNSSEQVSLLGSSTPDLFSGRIGQSFPIEVPPGRNGLQPAIALAYGGVGVNGWLGVGWDLEVGAIQRQIKDGVNYSADDYIFKSAGGGTELIKLPGTDEYRAKIEGGFLRFKKMGSNPNSYWEVTNKSGQKMFFGQTASAQQLSPDGLNIYKWCLSKVVDTHGNYISYAYSKDSGQIYLDRISYANHDNLTEFNQVAEVIFHLDDNRSDKLLSYLTNFEVRTTKRLKTIEVRTNDILYSSYNLTYQNSELTGRSRLLSIQKYGSDAQINAEGIVSGGSSLPKQTHAYRQETVQFDQTLGPAIEVADMDADAESSANDLQRLRFADFNGDGKIDMIRINGGGNIDLYYSNGATLVKQDTFYYDPVPSGTDESFELSGFQVGDFNGDGRADIIQVRPETNMPMHIYLAESGGFSSVIYGPSVDSTYVKISLVDALFPPNIVRMKVSYLNGMARLHLGDYNGDGKTDIGWVVSENGASAVPMKIFLSSGNSFNDEILGPYVALRGIESIKPNNYKKFKVDEGRYVEVKSNYYMNFTPIIDLSRVFTGDFDGNGKTDIAIVGDGGNTYIYLSDGIGFSRKITGPYLDKAYYPHKLSYLRVGDFNGDGKSDFARFIVYPESGPDKPVQIYLSNGSGFEPALYGPPMHYYMDATFADFNGDGKTDIIELPNNFSGASSTGPITQPIQIQLALEPDGDQFPFQLINGPSHTVNNSQPIRFVDYSRINYGDINGDGQLDIIRINGADSSSDEPMDLFLSSEDSAFPNMLKQIDNGVGGKTSIEYQSSSDVDNGGNLPLVYPLVESITTDDSNGTVALTEFKFDGGYFHKGEKEFRGFHHVKVVGPENGAGERKIDETWFHQGDGIAVDEYNPGAAMANMQGRPYRQRTSDSSGTIYAEVQTAYHQDLDEGPAYFNPVEQVDSYGLDGESSNFHARVSIPDNGYDDYGNVLLRMDAGDVSTALDDITVEKSYIYNTDDYLVGLIKAEAVYEGLGVSGSKTSQATYFYDEALTFPAGDPPYNTIMTNQSHSSQPPTTGDLTSIVRWNDRGQDVEEYFQYDAYGNLVKQRDGNGYVTVIHYDSSFTFPTGLINPLGHSEQITYYGVNGQTSDQGLYGQQQSQVDPNGARATFVYDKLGRVANQSLSDGSWTSTEYVGFGTDSQHVYSSNELGLWSRNYFDGWGRTTTETSSGPDDKTIAVQTVYEKHGFPHYVTLPYYLDDSDPGYTTMHYDVLGRVVQTDYPDGTHQLSCYENNITAQVDPNGHLSRQVNDARGRLARVEQFQGVFESCTTAPRVPYAVNEYLHSAVGSLTRVTDTLGHQTIMSYDSLGRKIFMRDPDMGDWSYNYDNNGNLVYQRDAKGQVITFAYDPLDRVTLKSYPTSFDTMQGLGGSGENTFAYISNEAALYYPISVDGVGQSLHLPDNSDVSYDYDDPAYNYAIGKLVRMTDGSGKTEYFYNDPLDRSILTRKTIGASNYDLTVATDSLGRLTAITYPDSEKVDYSYDAGGNLWQVGANGAYASFSGYNAFGKVGQVEYGISGVYAGYEYWLKNGRLKRINVNNASQALLDRGYSYDDNGNVKTITDYLNASRSQTFIYDELNRMTNATSGSAVYGALGFEYDQLGNLLQKDGIGFTTNANKPHQVAASSDGNTYQYDANGNMVSDGQRSIAYNADNLPVWIDNGAATNFEYDGNGSRVRKGGRVYFDDLYECATLDCGKYIFAGSERIALKADSGELYYYHSDHLGSTSLMTENGVVIEDLFYKPFGEKVAQQQGGFSPSHMFTGQEFDDETGLYYYNARYYNPVIGRFVSADSVVPYPDDSQSFNRYSYTRNNPINFIDPSGHADLINMTFDAGPYTMPSSGSISFGENFQFEYAFSGDFGEWNAPYTAPGEKAYTYVMDRQLNSSLSNLNSGNELQQWYGAVGFLQATIMRAAYPFFDNFVFPKTQGEAMSAPVGGMTKLLPLRQIPNAGGVIRSFVTKSDEIFYRVFSGNRRVGSFLTKVPPKSKKFAQEALSLPPQNQADFIQEVLVPAGTRLQRSRALSVYEWDRYHGAAEQFELLERIPVKNFGEGIPLK